MGKNQQHKDRQRAMSSRYEGGEGEAAVADLGGVDVSYHTPEWHAARIQALTQERMSWEDWKKKAAEKDKLMDDEQAMRAYRAQLDADRARILARGTKNENLKLALEGKKIKKKDRKRSKDKDKKRKKRKGKDESSKKQKSKSKKSGSSKKNKHTSTSGSSSSSSSSSDNSQQ